MFLKIKVSDKIEFIVKYKNKNLVDGKVDTILNIFSKYRRVNDSMIFDFHGTFVT